MKTWLLMLSMVSITACSSILKPSLMLARPPLRFETVMGLEPGKTRQSEVQTLFGEPDLKTASTDGFKQLWAYGKGRLTLFFDTRTTILNNIDWSVYTGDSEKDLAIAKSHFPHSHFIEEKEEWRNPHAAPTRLFYLDTKAGITITTRISTSQVSSIYREVPGSSRQPAASKPTRFEL